MSKLIAKSQPEGLETAHSANQPQLNLPKEIDAILWRG